MSARISRNMLEYVLHAHTYIYYCIELEYILSTAECISVIHTMV